MHTGRLRTWNSAEQWGYIWSEVHDCDVFVDGAIKGILLPLCEGDSMIFALDVDDEGWPIATHARSAHPRERVEKLLDETEKALRLAEQFAGCNRDAETIHLDPDDPCNLEVASLCERFADSMLGTEIEQVKQISFVRTERRRWVAQ